eukprot:748646-Hanusia_phi.AAC.1
MTDGFCGLMEHCRVEGEVEQTTGPRQGLQGHSLSLTLVQNMKRVSEFDTIEDFWGTINNIPPPSKLPVGCNYHLFREGIMPMWEDAHNAKGGKWTYNEKRNGGRSTKTVRDRETERGRVLCCWRIVPCTVL